MTMTSKTDNDNSDTNTARLRTGREFGGQSKFFAATGAEPGAVDYTRSCRIECFIIPSRRCIIYSLQAVLYVLFIP